MPHEPDELIEKAAEAIRRAEWAARRSLDEAYRDMARAAISVCAEYLALHFSTAETPKTPEHIILSGDGLAERIMRSLHTAAARLRGAPLIGERDAICRIIEANAPTFDDRTKIPHGSEVEKLADLILSRLRGGEREEV